MNNGILMFMLTPAHAKSALCILRRSKLVKKHGFRKYPGNHIEICKKIIEDCWNGTFYLTSAGHFRQFWIRDFCISVPGLMMLGHRKRVHKTLQYALNIYSSANILSTAITPENKPIHVFDYAPDSLPMLLQSLRLAKAPELVEIYKPFLESQIEYYFTKVLDPDTGMVKKEKFSSMKDNFYRHSSCYDNCMLSMLKDEIEKLNLSNPFGLFDFRKTIKDNLWNGKYFYDDMKKQDYVAGDANTFPFWCRVFDDEKMFETSLQSIRESQLDNPFPLKYTEKRPRKPMFLLNMLLPDYETNTVWIHLGLCFIDVVARYNPKLAALYLSQYRQNIEEHKNFLELYNSDARPFIRRFYASDESMLWASKYFELILNTKTDTDSI